MDGRPPIAALHIAALPVALLTALIAALLLAPAAVRAVDYGANAPIPYRLLPADNPWNVRVDTLPLDPNSADYITHMSPSSGLHPDFGTVWEGSPIGIPYVVVPGDQPKVPIDFYYSDESDPGPYPIPPDAPVEGGPLSDGDRHVLVLDPDDHLLYEVYDAHKDGDQWHAGSGAVFDLASNALRPDGWTSADAAGLPILPGLVRYDEVVGEGVIDHALRFTVAATQRAYVYPATHFASSNTDPDLPPMGLRLRLKASYDLSDFPPEVRVVDLVEQLMVGVEDQHVPVAAVEPAAGPLHGGIRRDRVRTGVALVGVVEVDGHLGLIAGHHHVRDADRGAAPHRAEVRVQAGFGRHVGDVVDGARVERQSVDARVPRVVGGKQQEGDGGVGAVLAGYGGGRERARGPVSYTHLTLPTNREV